ncbi:hypothetical protein TRFO_28847 [Tritrichomonas foetus]|uniref:Uncharacterized protein n=1 Tax=Tritrichomonas foetus TaxID=1144522 RepID=A0A1J4JYV6_9EUKA|nr:hypothetical protein TRFO_28847 [Tritrichomonas foetus]|eukprot:OHT03664.1 hypothetical protein TRFO_28847 [Tritrichomonas foetus]
MSVPSYLRPMQDIPHFNLPLDDDQQSGLMMNFAASTCPHIETDAPVPDSPTTSLQNAAGYLIKLNQRGYPVLRGMSPDQIKRSFNRSLKPVLLTKARGSKENTSSSAINEMRYNDPQLKFFLTSHATAKVRKKISELPFKVSDDKPIILSKLEEKIVELGHRMIHMRLFDYKKMSRTQLQQSTAKFVEEAHKVGDEIIRSCLREHLLDLNKLSREFKEEFKEFFPEPKVDTTPRKATIPPSKLKSDEIFNKVFDITRKGCSILPSTYRPKVKDLRYDTRPSTAVQMKKKLKNIALSIDHVLTRPATAPVKLENDSNLQSQKPPRKPPEVITSNFHRAPKPIISNRSTRKSKSSRKSSREKKELELKKAQEQADKFFWEIGDPLGSARSGEYVDQLNTIRSLSSNINSSDLIMRDDENYRPFSFTSNVTNPSTPILSNSNSMDDLITDVTIMIDPDTNNNSENANPNEKNKNENKSVNKAEINDEANNNGHNLDNLLNKESILRSSFKDTSGMAVDEKNNPLSGNYDVSDSKSQLLNYLHDHVDDFDDGDVNNSKIYQRLGAIWEDLGFSITQKLDMVVKYSKTLEDSNKLTEAVDAWENAYMNIMNYQTAYKAMKIFLTSEYLLLTPEKNSSLYLSLLRDIKSAIDCVETSAQYLKSALGDDLLMKHRKINDLISIREMKLQRLFSGTGIEVDEILEGDDFL